jgi:hypothetical protein
MAVKPIGREFVGGIQSLLNLMEIVSESIRASHATAIARTGGFEFSGFSFYTEDTRCIVVVNYLTPSILEFEANDISEGLGRNIGFGLVRPDGSGFNWKNKIDLDSGEVHFFTLSIEHQRKSVNQFIQSSIEVVKEIRKTEDVEPYDGGPLCI